MFKLRKNQLPIIGRTIGMMAIATIGYIYIFVKKTRIKKQLKRDDDQKIDSLAFYKAHPDFHYPTYSKMIKTPLSETQAIKHYLKHNKKQHSFCVEALTLSNLKNNNNQISDKINIVMLCYNRIHNLKEQLHALEKQTVAEYIHLHLVNNNSDLQKAIMEITNHSCLNITVQKCDNSHKCMERFFYARDHLYSPKLDYVIFVDDDQTFDPTWVERMWLSARPKTFLTWYGKTFDKDNPNYWDKNALLFCLKSKDQNISFDYGGPGGSIIDASIFAPTSKLFQFTDEKPYYMDDLWLSYTAKACNFTIKHSCLPPIQITDESTSNLALYKSLYHDKQQYLEQLLLKPLT